MICLTVLIAVLGARIGYLQLWRGDDLARKQARSSRQRIVLPSRRGEIRTRDGLLLAHDQCIWLVGIDPQAVAGPPNRAPAHERERRVREAVRAVVLAGIRLRHGRSVLERESVRRLHQGKMYYPLGEIETPRAYHEFTLWRRLQWLEHGIVVDAALRRNYPQGELAAQIVGVTAADRRGIAGIEQVFDDELRGVRGVRVTERAHEHRLVGRDHEEVVPIHGADLVLTLDARLQSLLERSLEEARSETQAETALGIIMDPRDGAILAAASSPGLDRSSFGRQTPADRARRRLQVTHFTYEPGSVIKGLILAEAHLSGVDPTVMLTEGQASWTLPYRTIRDEHPRGPLMLEGAVIHSSNIGLARLGRILGRDRLQRCLDRFRIGDPTGFELYEESGLRPSTQGWVPSTTLSVPIGYTFSTTALQMARAYCAIANGGYLVTPHVIWRKDSGTPSASRVAGPPRRRILPEAVAARVRGTLRRVITEGTGKHLGAEDLPLAGKTGTARRYGNGGYVPGEYVSTFVGFVPYDRPRYLACIAIDRPRGRAYFASQVAGPVARRLLGYLMGEPDSVIQAQIEAALAASFELPMIPTKAKEVGDMESSR